MIKFAYLVHRLDGMTREAFIEHHRVNHAPLFKSIPEARHVRRYVISHPVAAPGYPEPNFDALTEIWFDSWEDHDAYFKSENYRTKVQPDEGTFVNLDSYEVMVTEERIVIG